MENKKIISEVFNIPTERLETQSNQSVITSVPKSWLEKIKLTGSVDESITSSSTESRIGIQIMSLNCSDFDCTISDNSSQLKKIYSKSFLATLSTVCGKNSDGLYKETIRTNPNYYCPTGKTDFPQKSVTISNIKSCFELILKMHNVKLLQWQANHLPVTKCRANSNFESEAMNDWPTHANLKKAVCGFYKDNMIFLIMPKLSYTVHDALMYSSALLPVGSIKTLFVLHQILQFMRHFQDIFCRDISSLHWDNIELDSQFWVKVNLHEDIYSMTKYDDNNLKPENSDRQQEKELSYDQFPDLLDKWVCGELSNFDYLMFLNKLAGRTKLDPNHHPVLPWVSTLESENGQLRDLTKSKYRLNKGDHQLDIQYAMMHDSADIKDTKSKFQSPNLPQVPHHVPEFLSDITYYVYMARRTSKDILCKLVRSYWEPNEYPASIQRMQAWTPDECIPEFYTDAIVFKSIHKDMTDLAVPTWCSDAEDFIKKHRVLLESDSVSSELHHWIDVTFGYKLSGREAIEEKNVCLPLVDNHTKQTNGGISQLFQLPHPQKRCRMQSPEMPLKLEVSEDGFDLPASFNPMKELEELEKLLLFKSHIWNSTDFSTSLTESLEKSRSYVLSKDQRNTIISDRNVITFICLMIELYLSSQMRTKSRDLPLAERFKMCLQCYKLHKGSLPSGIKFAVEYFITNFRYSEELTYGQIAKTSDPSQYTNLPSIFETISDRGLPTPTPSLLLSPYIHVLPFPPYFGDLYDVINFILMNTNHHTQPLTKPALSVLCKDLRELFEKLHDTEEYLDILTPHIQQLLRQPSVPAIQFLIKIFDIISKAMGKKATQQDLFPLILTIYESSIKTEDKENSSNAKSNSRGDSSKQDSDDEETSAEKIVSWNGEEVEVEDKTKRSTAEDQSKVNETINNSTVDTVTILEEIYKESFLLQLSTRLGLLTFMENIPRCLANALIAPLRDGEYKNNISDISKRSICWLMQRIGPTITSKYIVKHLFRVLNRCFLIQDKNACSESRHAAVLACLIHAAALFGTSIITLQYFPQLIHNVVSAVMHPKFAPRHQAAVEASVVVVTYFVLYLSDAILVEQLTRLSKEVIIPITHLLSRTDICFYGGAESRKALCMKVIHLMKLIVIRIGREMARAYLTPLFQEFFSQFSRQQISRTVKQHEHDGSFESVDTDTVVIDHDADTRTFKVGNTVLLENSSGMRRQLHKSWFNASPTPSPNKGIQILKSLNDDEDSSLKEIEATFCPETAYCSYVSFTRIVGNIHMENILGENHDHIWRLRSQHEAVIKEEEKSSTFYQPASSPINKYSANIKVVGNKIVVATPSTTETKATTNNRPVLGGMHTGDLTVENTRRTLEVFPESQLTENKLAYWEHEIGLPENDKHIHFNQIELQAFNGHSSAVRCLSCHQSEEWFVSGSKDKMVKIWSLWNNGETKSTSSDPCFTYKNHKKGVSYVGIVDTEQLIISNDGNIHVWDPYTGQQVMVFDNTDVKSGFALVSTLPSPQRYALALTTERYLRFIDFRSKILAHEYKTMAGNSVGLARSICTSSDGQWVAIGFSTGVISVLDVRTGVILSIRQAHEADIATMTTVSENQFLTASNDQTVALWDIGRASPVMVYRSYQEPVHAVQTFNNEIISASVANRITVHLLPGEFENMDGVNDSKSIYDKTIAISKLRSDAFRGVLTSFSVLPMKRQLLIASDNGNIKLMA